jgi:hypothetical protein
VATRVEERGKTETYVERVMRNEQSTHGSEIGTWQSYGLRAHFTPTMERADGTSVSHAQRSRDLARAGIERARARQDANRERAMHTPIEATNKVSRSMCVCFT